MSGIRCAWNNSYLKTIDLTEPASLEVECAFVLCSHND